MPDVELFPTGDGFAAAAPAEIKPPL